MTTFGDKLAGLETQIKEAAGSIKDTVVADANAVKASLSEIPNTFVNTVVEVVSAMVPAVSHRRETLDAQESAAMGDTRPLPTPGSNDPSPQRSPTKSL
jgi:hypothetical protein